MAQNNPDGGRYGIDVGTRWRNASGSMTVIVLEVQRTGVIVYRLDDAPDEDERVTNVVRFVQTFAPAGKPPVEQTGERSEDAAARLRA